MTCNRMQRFVDQAVQQLLRSDDRSREAIEKIARELTHDTDEFTTKHLAAILIRGHGEGPGIDSQDGPVEPGDGADPEGVTSDIYDPAGGYSTEPFTTPDTVTDRFHAVDWKQLTNREEDAHWLLEPVLPKGRLVALYADGKSGKSLLALDMALDISTGRDILKQLSGEQVTVMYIDQEMTLDDLEERVSDLGYDPTWTTCHVLSTTNSKTSPRSTPQKAGNNSADSQRNTNRTLSSSTPWPVS
jgi:hypothetical protein